MLYNLTSSFTLYTKKLLCHKQLWSARCNMVHFLRHCSNLEKKAFVTAFIYRLVQKTTHSKMSHYTFASSFAIYRPIFKQTSHRASTSKYSLTFRVRTVLSQQRNPCTDCKSTQYCTTRGHPRPFPQVTSGSVQ